MQQLTASASKVYDDFCCFMEKENRMNEFGLYGLGTAVFVYACYRKRPMKKFTQASQIPKHFVEEKVLQTGIVRKIEPTEKGPLLLVNHQPPVNVSFSKRALPIKVAGVHIDGNGYSWLQILALNEKVNFLPLNSSGNECEAKVFLVQPGKKSLDIGRALVGLGFARAAPLTQKIDANVEKSFQSYMKQLKLSEAKAKSLRKGQWSFLPETWLRWYLRTSIEKIVFNMKPLDKKLPALVR